MRTSPPPRQTLCVLIDEHWPHEPAAPWVLADDAGVIHAQGTGPLAEWPQDVPLVVILGASQSSWHSVTLPLGGAALDPRVIAYALEDALLEAPQAQHITVVDRHNEATGTQAELIVTAQARLRTIIGELQAAGRHPRLVLSELQGIAPTGPAGESDLQLRLRPGAALLRHAGGMPIVLRDDLADLSAFLGDMIGDLLPATSKPARVELWADPACRSLAAGLADALGAHATVTHRPYAWWSSAIPGHPGERTARQVPAANLLHGDFATGADGARRAGRLRRPLAVAAGALIVLAAVTVADILRMRAAVEVLEEDIATRFSTALPGTPMVMPESQLNRQLDHLRQRSGAVTRDGLLFRLDQFAAVRAEAPAASIVALDYREGTLSLALADADAREIDRLRTLLAPDVEIATALEEGR